VVLAFAACNDSAEVLTPDTGTPEEAGADVQANDVTTQPDSSDATIDGRDDAPADAPADAPVCEAGLEICNSACTDPSTYQTDPKNCGFCGHDCLGNACAIGLCAPDTIGSTLPTPSNLAVDGTNVYVTTSGDGSPTATSGAVYQCPVTGCPTKLGPMTSSLNNPNGITLDSTNVYWVNSGDLGTADGSVMSCPLSDCGKNDASRVAITKNRQFVQGIAVDATNVYFNYWGAAPYGNGRVASCPLAGCSGAPAAIITGQYKPLYVALDGSTIFAAIMGGGASVPYIQSGPIPGPSTGTRVYTGTIQNQIGGFALYGGFMYFSDAFTGEIDACSETSCTTAVPLASSLNMPGSIAVDAKGIYWIDGNGTSIETCPLKGCTAPTLLATPTQIAVNLALNGNYVYWVEDDANSNANAGLIMRVAR
jgi:hypothetical protein